MTAKITSQRQRYLMVTAATLLPIVSLLLIVFYTSYRPIFLAMENIVHKSIRQIEPLNELQMAIINAAMPPNDYLIHGGEDEKKNWQDAKLQVQRAFSAVHSANIPGMSPEAFAEMRKMWEHSVAKGDLLFLVKNTACVNPPEAQAMEDFDRSVVDLSARVAQLIENLKKDVHADHAEVEKLKIEGFLIIVTAIVLGLLTGVGGSIWLTRARKKMVDLSLHDPLTGVFNRRALQMKLEHLHKEHAAAGSEDFSVLLIDIDHFKKVNDHYGHDAGDEVLRGFGKLIGGIIRSQDVFGRFGGEEFLVLLPRTDRKNALLLAERIRRAVEDNPVRIAHGESIRVTVSIGCASSSAVSDDPQKLVQAADMAMYKAKNAGRNRVV